MGDCRIDWTTWERPTNPLIRGLHATGARIDSYYGRKFIEAFIKICFEDSLKNINDDYNSHIELQSLDVERGGVLCYFELSDQRDATIFDEDARQALLLLLARIGEALKSGEMPGYVLADIRQRHLAALAWNH